MDLINKDNFHSISKYEFFDEWLKWEKSERNVKLFDFFSSKFNICDVSEQSKRELKKNIANWSSKIADKWYKAGKSKNRFLIKNKTWLDAENYQFHLYSTQLQPYSASEYRTPTVRQLKGFEESSFKTKKRRVEDLVKLRSFGELITAAEIVARSEGNRNTAREIRDISTSTNLANKSIACKDTSSPMTSRQLSGNEALAYYIDSKSTTNSYKQTKKWSMKAGHHVFPSYHCLSKSKKACCPSNEHIVVTETRAEINLQAMLDKTCERLVEAQDEVIRSVLPNSSITLISKWGCDGSSGHSTYKQKFENQEATDEFLFIFSFVPIRLVDYNIIIWQNPRPSSTRFCRPIKFIFAKETTEFTKKETSEVLEEINHLLPSVCKLGDSLISVKHELLLTMTDGKVCNALTETLSPQKCFICGATPKMMNQESINYNSNPDNFGFGLSTLHAWIRCVECCLHISYKLEIKKWQARSNEEKACVKQRSDHIKQQFRQVMGLIVDKPRSGFGTTNDGNTARRFFGNPELSARITGLDVTLLTQFNILLSTLSSGYEINLVEFNKLCINTRKLYLSLYSWYNMPATVHKILIHSPEVIKSAIVPIGQLSEEAQEARNKDCRRFRLQNTRKCSRTATNMDLLTMLIVTSDPLINSLREIPKKKTDRLSEEVRKLIISPNLEPQPLACASNFQNQDDYNLSDSSEDSDNDG